MYNVQGKYSLDSCEHVENVVDNYWLNILFNLKKEVTKFTTKIVSDGGFFGLKKFFLKVFSTYICLVERKDKRGL